MSKSFILEIEKKKVKTKLDFFENGLKFVKKQFLKNIFDVIKRNFEYIKKLGLEVAESIEKSNKKIAVCIYYDNKPIYKFKNLYEKFKDVLF